MSKSRIMGAASSGYNYGANKNSPGNGNGKWQGLWPSVGHARNARLINTRAGGDNRNVVFCINQLGGVGRISNMFATTADGVQDCKNGCILPSNIRNALQQLTNYASKRGLLLGLAGVKETVKSDLPNTSGLTPFDKNFSPEMQQYVDLINGLGLEFAVTGPKDIQRHEVVMLTETDAEKLKAGGYGVPTLCDNIIAYGGNCDNIAGLPTNIDENANIDLWPNPTFSIKFTTTKSLGGGQVLANGELVKTASGSILTIQVGEEKGGYRDKNFQGTQAFQSSYYGRLYAGIITDQNNPDTKYSCYMAPKNTFYDGSKEDAYRNQMIIQGITNETGTRFSGKLESLPVGDYTFTMDTHLIYNERPFSSPGSFIPYKIKDIYAQIGNGPICKVFKK